MKQRVHSDMIRTGKLHEKRWEAFDANGSFVYLGMRMDTEFYSLQLTRAEALELFTAMMQRSLLEDDLRREKGLEPIGPRPVFHRLLSLLRVTHAQVEKWEEAVDTELWEHAWYTFTDEWAWFRAAQEVERELGDQLRVTDQASLQRQIERQYTKDFEKYVGEIDMKEPPTPSSKGRGQRKTA